MTNNTIQNVPRELLADLLGNDHDKRIMAERHLLAMLANATSPAGVDGLEVIGWYTDDHLNDKSATTYSRKVADRWLAKGWPVTGIANAADAKTIIDGLRGDAERYRALRNSLSGQQHCSHTEMPCISDPISPFVTYTPEGLDAAIDAALSAGKEGE